MRLWDSKRLNWKEYIDNGNAGHEGCNAEGEEQQRCGVEKNEIFLPDDTRVIVRWSEPCNQKHKCRQECKTVRREEEPSGLGLTPVMFGHRITPVASFISMRSVDYGPGAPGQSESWRRSSLPPSHSPRCSTDETSGSVRSPFWRTRDTTA